ALQVAHTARSGGRAAYGARGLGFPRLPRRRSPVGALPTQGPEECDDRGERPAALDDRLDQRVLHLGQVKPVVVGRGCPAAVLEEQPDRDAALVLEEANSPE